MTRPPWNDAMSDGCSVPTWLLDYVPLLAQVCAVARDICVAHDRAYYEGGTEEDRERADLALRDALEPRIGAWLALEFYNAVRLCGGSHWGTGRTWDGRALWQAAGTEAP